MAASRLGLNSQACHELLILVYTCIDSGLNKIFMILLIMVD